MNRGNSVISKNLKIASCVFFCSLGWGLHKTIQLGSKIKIYLTNKLSCFDDVIVSLKCLFKL